MSPEPRVFFVPLGDFDPAAPTMADLARGVELTEFIADDGLRFDSNDAGAPARPTLDEIVSEFVQGRPSVPRFIRVERKHQVIDGEIVEPANRAERRALTRGDDRG